MSTNALIAATFLILIAISSIVGWLLCMLYHEYPNLTKKKSIQWLAIPDAHIQIDNKGIILESDSAASMMFGYLPSELRGRNVKILMPEPYHSGHDNYLAEYHRTGIPKVIGSGREVFGRRRDGTIFPLLLKVSEIGANLDSDERIFIGICRNLTTEKLKQMEIELATLKQN